MTTALEILGLILSIPLALIAGGALLYCWWRDEAQEWIGGW
jgi:hypothetical protein